MTQDPDSSVAMFLRALFSLGLLVAAFGIARSWRSGDPVALLLAVALTLLFGALGRAPQLLGGSAAGPPRPAVLWVYRLALVLLVGYAVVALFR
ncbi:MAG: hypothetical protein AAF604_15255 [Acidobacteriota bacterium]